MPYEIKNLDTPLMTTVFRVKDRLLLDNAKETDRIRFAVEHLEGTFTVTALDSAKPNLFKLPEMRTTVRFGPRLSHQRFESR